jgi:hypothetical protein
MAKKMKRALPGDVEQPVNVVNSGQGVTYYCNRMEIGFSNYDFRLRIHEIFDSNEKGQLVKELALVYLAPGHAKAVAALFLRQIHEYEKKFGPIQSPTRSEKGADISLPGMDL